MSDVTICDERGNVVSHVEHVFVPSLPNTLCSATLCARLLFVLGHSCFPVPEHRALFVPYSELEVFEKIY